MRRAIAVLLVVAGLGLAAYGFSSVAAADSNAQVTITFTILPAEELMVTPSSIDFGDVVPETPTAATAVTVTARCNQTYELTYTATDFTSGSYTVPIQRLSYDGGTTPFSSSGTIATGLMGENVFNYQYVLQVTWDDYAASGYSGSVTYTLTPTP
ncbi:MAG TPA: hypothetical protein DHW14_06130 [Clostridiales bacterium]|nr:hypothetical protein [Clostridiales bacterium]